MSWHVSPWVYPVWDSLCFLALTMSFPLLQKFSTIISSKVFSVLFFFSSFFGGDIQMLVHLIFSQQLWDDPQFFSVFFSLLSSSAVIFIFLSSSSLIHSSASVILLLILSSVFLISVIVLFITVYSLFLLCPHYICEMILEFYPFYFWDFWKAFTIIILSSFSGSLPISSYLVLWIFTLFLHLHTISLPFHLI